MTCTRRTTQRWKDTNVEWQNYNESWCLDLPTIPHDRQITAQLAVSRPDQTFEDITDYLLSCSVELGDIDQVGTGNLGGDSTVRQFDFTLQNDREGVDGDSFHPLDKASEWNRQGGEWAPLLWPLREVVFRVAIQSQPEYEQPKGTTEQFSEFVGVGDGTSQTFDLDYGPTLPFSETVYVDGEETTDYEIDYDAIPSTITTSESGEIVADYTYFRELFAGYLGDSIQSSEDGTTITCEARDYSKLIQDTYIDAVREYGDDNGNVLAEDVIQQILNDNMGTDAPDLYTPTSSNFAILPYDLDYQSAWDAIQEVASQIGWFLGYLWDNDNLEWRLTFKPPPRDKEVGDYELTAQDDIYTADLDISDSDVRNVIEVEHRNEDEGDVQTAIVEDQDSIDEFRERRMTIGVQDAPHIDTLEEGERLAENILSDLKNLSSTTRANIPIFPDADLYTAFDVDDPRLTSETQFYAVETLRHDFRWGSNPQFRTEFTAGGRVIGSKHKWLRMETRPGAGQPIAPERIGGGSDLIPDPTGVEARGIIRGIIVEFNPPPVHQNRWAESKVYISTSAGIDISDPNTYEYTKTGKQAYFEVTDELNFGVEYHAVVTHIDVQDNETFASDEVSATSGNVDWSDVFDDGNKPEDGATENKVFEQENAPDGEGESNGDIWIKLPNGTPHIYEDGKWNRTSWDDLLDDDTPSDSSTLTVAANNSSVKGTKNADFVCNGSNDQVQINNAIDSLAGGGKVTLLEGEYFIDSEINVNSDISISGQGNSTKIIVPDDISSNLTIFDIDTSTGVKIKNLSVNGNETNHDYDITGVYFINNESIKIYDVNFRYINIGVDFENSENITVNNCNFIGQQGARGTGVVADESSSVIVSNCIVIGVNYFVEIFGCTGLQIINNNLNSCLRGIRTYYNENVSIKSNEIKNTDSGVPIIADGEDIVIHENSIHYYTDYGIEVYSSQGYNDIQENTCRRKGYNSDGAIYIGSGTGNLISSNDFYDSGENSAITDVATDTEFGAGNRVNNGDWIVGADG